MRRGTFAVLVVAVIAIALIAQVPAANGGVSLGTLAMRDTPQTPPGTVSLGIDWTPWIVLGVALAAFAAVGLALLRLRGRRPLAPATAPIDRLPDDWPQL